MTRSATTTVPARRFVDGSMGKPLEVHLEPADVTHGHMMSLCGSRHLYIVLGDENPLAACVDNASEFETYFSSRSLYNRVRFYALNESAHRSLGRK